MKKNLITIIITILLLLVQFAFLLSLHSNNSMAEFVVGKWYGEFKNVNSNNILESRTYELEFVSADVLQLFSQHILVLNIKSPTLLVRNNLYRYEFNSPNEIHISPIERGEGIVATITKDGDSLIVDYPNSNIIKHLVIPPGRYIKQVAINWPIIALWLGFLMYWIFRIVKQRDDYHWPEYTFSNFSGYFITVVVFVVGMCIGLVASFSVLLDLSPIVVRIPWDKVIALEATIAVGVFGKKFRESYMIDSWKAFFRFGSWQYYLGIILEGYSLSGILQIVMWLVIFVFSVRY